MKDMDIILDIYGLFMIRFISNFAKPKPESFPVLFWLISKVLFNQPNWNK